MKKYIGVKMIEAEPMTNDEYITEKYGKGKLDNPTSEGYKVKYSDDYISWSPKEVFEEAYIEFPENSALKIDEVKEFIRDSF